MFRSKAHTLRKTRRCYSKAPRSRPTFQFPLYQTHMTRYYLTSGLPARCVTSGLRSGPSCLRPCNDPSGHFNRVQCHSEIFHVKLLGFLIPLALSMSASFSRMLPYLFMSFMWKSPLGCWDEYSYISCVLDFRTWWKLLIEKKKDHT